MQAGMLHALYEQHVRADVMVGASAGALNAAFASTLPQTSQSAIELGRVWESLHRGDVFPIGLRALVSGTAGHSGHLVSDRGLRRIAERHLQLRYLEDAETEVHVVAFDLVSGREILVSDGPAVEALLASAAIPGVLPPVVRDGMLLIDGGVINNTPISHAVALGAERVYVLPTRDASELGAPRPRRPLDAAIHAVALLAAGRLQSDIDLYAREVDLIVLPAPNPLQISPTDFEHPRELIAGALAASRGALTTFAARSAA